jgi:hypothetical protein
MGWRQPESQLEPAALARWIYGCMRTAEFITHFPWMKPSFLRTGGTRDMDCGASGWSSQAFLGIKRPEAHWQLLEDGRNDRNIGLQRRPVMDDVPLGPLGIETDEKDRGSAENRE